MSEKKDLFVYTYSAEPDHEKSLYVNLTNRCTNRCTFCIRNNKEGVGGGTQLWLSHEPSVEEIIAALKEYDVDSFTELVFCGYGEPTIRIDELITVAKWVKENYKVKTRINTNGHGSEFHGHDITPLFDGVIDTVSVSLNAASAEEYDKTCKSIYGIRAYEIMLDFAKKAKAHTDVVLSIVDVLPPEEIEACRKIAAEAGVRLKVREYVEE